MKTSSIYFKLSIVLFSLCFVNTNLHAQEQTEISDTTTTAITVTNHSISTEILALTYNYEYALGTKCSVVGRLGLQSGLGYNSTFGTRYTIHPGISIEPRYYYNLQKREQKGKRTNKNSANYLALTSWYILDPIVEHNSTGNSLFLIAPNWGIRRVYGNAFLLEFNTGISYSIDEYKTEDWNLLLNLRVGYVF